MIVRDPNRIKSVTQKIPEYPAHTHRLSKQMMLASVKSVLIVRIVHKTDPIAETGNRIVQDNRIAEKDNSERTGIVTIEADLNEGSPPTEVKIKEAINEDVLKSQKRVPRMACRQPLMIAWKEGDQGRRRVKDCSEQSRSFLGEISFWRPVGADQLRRLVRGRLISPLSFPQSAEWKPSSGQETRRNPSVIRSKDSLNYAESFADSAFTISRIAAKALSVFSM